MTEKYVIIICSAINIPEQSYDAQYQAGGEVRCETMSNVIVKRTRRWIVLYADSKETVQKLAFSRRFVKENTMKSQA